MGYTRKLLTVLDPSTGELADIESKQRRKPQRRKVFFMLDRDTEAMDDLLAQRLPATTLQVFLHALDQVQQNNVVSLALKDTAERCGLTEPQVSKALKKLREIEVLAQYREDRRILYMVNPAFGWNGQAHDYIAGHKRWAKLIEEQRTASTQPKLRLIGAHPE